MMKIIVTFVLALLVIATMAMAAPVLAAYNDFVADGNITVSGISGTGVSNVDFTIIDGSTAESFQVNDSNIFKVTLRDGSAFTVTTANSGVESVEYGPSGNVICANNANKGSTQFVLRGNGESTITPRSSQCASAVSSSPGGSAPGGGSTGDMPTTKTTETTETTKTVSTTPGVAATDASGKVTLEQMTTDAEIIVTGDVNQILTEMGVERDAATEANYNETIVNKVVAGSGITAKVRNTINNFVTYGTKATKILGAGERAGVVNSFQAALGKLPTTTEDWNDVVKIANGRWPNQRSTIAEDRATVNFRKIYLRDPDRSNPHDDAAVTVMAYGLRPADRNLDSEKAGIRHFKSIYGYNPESATAWDIVRAIAYSGAVR